MTSQYTTEPPPSGLVTLHTTKGPISVELFSTQTPLASRNFLTLALEGFYDSITFHRLIPNFIVQSGDPSGTGSGGESIFGHPFPIEPHSRLRFNRRGLLGMAAVEKQNESQFFLTLDATPELNGKHTMFGRVTGKSIYTLMELVDGVEVVEGDRPRYEIKLLSVEVVECPFDDLKPRITREQKREEKRREKEEMERRREEEEKTKRGGGGKKKNTKLLSFGGDEEEEVAVVVKGPKSSHDLLKGDKRLSKQVMEVEEKESKRFKRDDQAPPSATTEKAVVESKPDAAAASSSSKPIHAVASSSNGTTSNFKDSQPQPPSNNPPQPSPSSSSAKTYLTAQRAKYASSSRNQSDSYDALLSFQARLRSTTHTSKPSSPSHSPILDDNDDEEAKEYGASDDDNDWRSHRLDAGGAPLLASETKAEDYEVLDPRQHSKKHHEQERSGKRGRDWVEDRRKYSDNHDRNPSHKHHQHRR